MLDFRKGIFNEIWLILWDGELFFLNIALTFYPDRIFGQDFFKYTPLCDFLAIGHVFE